MIFKGSCHCRQWQLRLTINRPLGAFNPRLCDCSYCQNKPSALISAPDMVIDFMGSGNRLDQNGDELADFYYCDHCGDLLAVGRNLQGRLHGAVNASLLYDAKQLGQVVQIQPRLLNADEKLARWAKLWGILNGL